MSVLLLNAPDLDQASPAYIAAQAEKAGERSRKRATAADAFRLARVMFDAGRPLDMVALARAASSRPPAHRLPLPHLVHTRL